MPGYFTHKVFHNDGFSSHEIHICMDCGATVDGNYKHMHDNWHNNLKESVIPSWWGVLNSG